LNPALYESHTCSSDPVKTYMPGLDIRSYSPFGNIDYSKGSSDNKYQFTGKEINPESGLTYFGARYYHSVIGRWISKDSLPGTTYNPQSLNRYIYCLQNPLKFIDKFGDKPTKTIYKIGKFKIISSVVKNIEDSENALKMPKKDRMPLETKKKFAELFYKYVNDSTLDLAIEVKKLKEKIYNKDGTLKTDATRKEVKRYLKILNKSRQKSDEVAKKIIGEIETITKEGKKQDVYKPGELIKNYEDYKRFVESREKARKIEDRPLKKR